MKKQNKSPKVDRLQLMMEKLEVIENLLKLLMENKESLVGKEFLDNQDMCILLGIHKRTLQRYRQNGVVAYYMMKGKPYYKASEVEENLKRILKVNPNIKLKK